jgi:hypothetical protein
MELVESLDLVLRAAAELRRGYLLEVLNALQLRIPVVAWADGDEVGGKEAFSILVLPQCPGGCRASSGMLCM